MTTTTTTTEMLDTYFKSWNETDPAARAGMIAEAWTEDGRHVDPLADVQGHAALGEMVAGVQQQFPGHTLVRTSGVDAHHDQLRYAWQLVSAGGDVVVAAVDIAEVAEDGRLRKVAAFFGPVPDEAAA